MFELILASLLTCLISSITIVSRLNFNSVTFHYNWIYSITAPNPLKTVVLVRDPRAIINSRLNPSLGFCFGDCRNPQIVCQQIRSNLKSLIEMKANSSNLLGIIRFSSFIAMLTLIYHISRSFNYYSLRRPFIEYEISSEETLRKIGFKLYEENRKMDS